MNFEKYIGKNILIRTVENEYQGILYGFNGKLRDPDWLDIWIAGEIWYVDIYSIVAFREPGLN